MFEDDDDEGQDYNISEFIERFENYLKGGNIGFIDSDNIEMMIDHYLMNAQYHKASACADLGIEYYPFNLVFLLRKAQSISALGQLKEALELLGQVEKMEAPSCEFFLTKASIFSQLKDSKSAIKYFKTALSLSEAEDRDEIYLDLAIEYENSGNFLGAIEVLKEAIRNNPKNEGAIYEMAFCYDQIQDFEKAIGCYSDFIDENPYSFTAWYNLGNAYSKLENYEKAIWAYDYSLIINESFSPSYFNLGNAYLSNEKYQAAIDCFEKCIEIDGEDALALCYIGECHEQLENYALAKHYYHRSMEFNPELAEAWLGLGIVADLEDNTVEGIRYIEKAIELEPNNGSFYHVLASAFEKIEALEKANDAYLLSLELDNNNVDALNDYAEFCIDFMDLPASLAYFESYETATSNVLTKKLHIVQLMLLLGKESEACVLLQECILENEKSAKAIFSHYPKLKDNTKIVSLFS